MGDDGEIAILNLTGPGSTPLEPLVLVAKMSDFERNALESGRRGGLASAAEPTQRYSKCLSGKFKFSPTSHLYEFC